MNILDGLGIKRDDCFEKSDLIKRVEEYKESKKGAKKAPYEDSKPTQKETPGSQNTFTPSGQNFTYAPPAAHILFKITSVGNSEVGKSCLIKRYCEGRFVKRYISTIGVDYGVKKLQLKS